MSDETKPIEETKVEAMESTTGLKLVGANPDAVKVAEQKPAPDTQQSPSFFVEDDDRIRIEVDVLFEKSTGKLVSVSRSGMIDDKEFAVLGMAKEWFDFKPLEYEAMSNYRQRCMVFRRDANRMLTDPISIRNFLVVWHLKDWSLRGKSGEKIPLVLTEDGALDEASIKAVYKMNTTLLDVVLSLFEKDMMM
jgi:hypothetical protein